MEGERAARGGGGTDEGNGGGEGGRRPYLPAMAMAELDGERRGGEMGRKSGARRRQRSIQSQYRGRDLCIGPSVIFIRGVVRSELGYQFHSPIQLHPNCRIQVSIQYQAQFSASKHSICILG